MVEMFNRLSKQIKHYTKGEPRLLTNNGVVASGVKSFEESKRLLCLSTIETEFIFTICGDRTAIPSEFINQFYPA